MQRQDRWKTLIDYYFSCFVVVFFWKLCHSINRYYFIQRSALVPLRLKELVWLVVIDWCQERQKVCDVMLCRIEMEWNRFGLDPYYNHSLLADVETHWKLLFSCGVDFQGFNYGHQVVRIFLFRCVVCPFFGIFNFFLLFREITLLNDCNLIAIIDIEWYLFVSGVFL